MRYIPIKDAKPGMCLAYDLFDSSGRTLVGVNGVLIDKYITRLEEYGFDGIYIQDEISEGIEVETAISPKLRTEGILCVREKNIDKCKEIAAQIVEELLSKRTIPLDMMDLRSYDDYTYAHSVNVAVICCVIGMGIALAEKDLINLVLAALLHDLGKMTIPPEILNKPGRLSKEEYEIVKNHPQSSYELLSERWDISAHVKVAVLYHHENVDGSGYPDGISGSNQSLLTKIIHVADVYDALISKRPYKNPYSPQEAVEYLMGGCGILFDQKIVETLLKCVSLYPKGTQTQLSDGRTGIVFENSGPHNLRPIVKLFDGSFVDLLEKENLNLTLSCVQVDEQKASESDEIERREMIKGVRTKRILIVDDMLPNLQLLKGILEDYYELVLVKSGEQAIQYIKKGKKVDLVLMDINMPGMDGIETTEKIQEMTEEKLPVIFVTIVCDADTVRRCKELGAAGYIIRPYKPVYIKEEIKKILEGRSEME